jgi:hypothetical protein
MKLSIGATATVIAAATTTCLFLTACSGSSLGNASAAGAGGGVLGSSTALAASGGAGSGGGGNGTCKQLTFAEVQPLITETVIGDTTMAITVQVIGGSLGPTAYAQEVGGEVKPVAVSGVGDKASRDTESGEVNALKGDLYCSVSYSSSDDVPGVGPLEEAHGYTNNIGENYYDKIAQAMGTLCNRIYGSGNTTPDLSSLLKADATAVPSDGGGLPTSIELPTGFSTN